MSMNKLLIELIEAIEEYCPSTEGHDIPDCGSDFDAVFCQAGDSGGCARYETCKRETEFFEKLNKIKEKVKG